MSRATMWQPDPTGDDFPSAHSAPDCDPTHRRVRNVAVTSEEPIGFCDCDVTDDLVSHDPREPFVCQTCRKLPKPTIPIAEIASCK